MASTHKHIRSGTANKRPTTAIADGQIALATNIASPGLFFKDSAGATIVKIGPVHVGATAPNVSPAGSAGNSIGEVWLDTSLTPVGVKIYDGSAFVNATPIGSTTVQGLLELATDAETQAGADTARAITSASLQSKLSDSTSTTSNTTIASSTAVKAAYDLANAALPKTGGTVTGNLEIGAAGSLSFEGATADGFETTIAITDPTADRTITLPNTTGTVVTTGDSGTVTSTMLLDGTIVDADINASAAIAYSKLASLTSANILVGNSSNVATSTAVTGDVTISNAGVTAIAAGVIVNADINASAAIVDTKLATISTAGKVSNSATTAASANTASAIVARDGSGNFTAGTITAALTGAASSNVLKAGDTMTGALVVPLGAVGTPSLTFTGDTNTGIYSPGADQVAVATNGVQRINIEADGDINIDGGGVFYDATNNRLAIGTTSPGSELHVAKTGASDEPTLRIESENSDIYLRTAGSSGSFPTGGGPNDGELLYVGGDFRVGIGAASKNLIFINGSGYNERARIDSSGRLLVGTATDITGSTSFLMQAVSSGPAHLALGRSDGEATADARVGRIAFYSNAGSVNESLAWIDGVQDATSGSGDKPGRLVFSTTADGASSPTERMRITSGGHIYIVDGATYAAYFNGGSSGAFRWRAPTVQANSVMEGYASSTSTSRHILFSNPNGVVGSITTASSATAYNTSSDYRLKKNIANLDGAIDRLKQLPVHRFNFIADPDTVVDGFIAHEAAEVVPEAVTGTKDEVDDDGNPVYQGIDQSKLVPLLTAALQEAIGEIESLKARVVALESA